MNRLPQKWQEFLATKPESGMGYQVVNFVLNYGRRIEDVTIIQSAAIGEIKSGPVEFDPDTITDVEVLQAYPMVSGLTDDWGRLLESLKDIRGMCRHDLTTEEKELVTKTIAAIDELLRPES